MGFAPKYCTLCQKHPRSVIIDSYDLTIDIHGIIIDSYGIIPIKYDVIDAFYASYHSLGLSRNFPAA